jgi:hypothetical protein
MEADEEVESPLVDDEAEPFVEDDALAPPMTARALLAALGV